MPDKPWKREERIVAALFGVKRRLMKGTSEKADIGDNEFPLILDVKLWQKDKWEIRKWFRDIFHEAKRQGKIPVVSVRGSGLRIRYSFIKSTDLEHMILHCPRDSYSADDFYSGSWPQNKWRIIPWYKAVAKTAYEKRPGSIPILMLDGKHIHTEIGRLSVIRTEHLAEIFNRWRETCEEPK